MSNSSTIRTMKDDLDETTHNDDNIKTEDKKNKQNLAESIKESHFSDTESVNSEKQEEPELQKNSGIKEALAIIDTSVIKNDNNELNNSQDDQLALLIKKARNESDVDVEDKGQEPVETAPIVPLQDKKFVDEKDISLRKVIGNQDNKEVSNGGNNIDDLKNLIGKISKSSATVKNNSTTDSLENKKILEKKGFDSDTAEKTNNEKKEVHKKFLWSDLAKNNNGKKSENKIENKIDNIAKPITENQKNDKIDSLKSGVLDIEKDRQKKKDDKFNKEQSLNIYNENYVSPSERLIHGKQELYSSVSKTIKQRSDNDDIKSLKESERIKNEQNNAITKDEEYKKLKKGIIQKYHIKLSTLPWKKIVLVGVSFVILVGVSAYLLFSQKPVTPVVKLPVIITGLEIEKFSDLASITMDKQNLSGLGNPSDEAKAVIINDIKVAKLKIVDNIDDGNILTLEDALNVVLKKDKSFFYDGFFEETTGNYNILMFKTKKGSIRYGLAIETKESGLIYNVMRSWEADQTNSRKMISVFKNLFIDDASGDYSYKEFTSINFSGVEINYAHLENKYTALNYFIHNNLLIITTSIDSNSTMVDLVIEN